MDKLVLLALLISTTAAASSNEVGEARTGVITITGQNNQNNIAWALVALALIVGAIILLDFGIFGVFATRADKLNPVSRFFYHTREGFGRLKERWGGSRRYQRVNYGPTRYPTRFNAAGSEVSAVEVEAPPRPKADAFPDPVRVARSVGSGPVLDALAQAHKKYEEDEE